ncbi:glycosyltransferase [Frigoribacterium faeni]|uniref:glycosyltransferase n=1 Tax=Frigoribacterium faeni TaxID=145483 RepID=UPI001FAC669B|nr:glycosyltransferase [Frigoribacterium faeni]MCJ0700453.1 glycosyltransferase [Frigoribacterium faeni]
MRVLLTHPGAELYGSDRMAASAAESLVAAGHEVVAVLPLEGPLEQLLIASGAEVVILDLPVLRKALLRPAPFLGLVAGMARTLLRASRLIRRERIDVVYTNTITQPWWTFAARLCRRPTLVHVREAETEIPVIAQRVLLSPLALADSIVANSNSTRRHVETRGVGAKSKTKTKTTVVHNGKDWDKYYRSPYDPGVAMPNLVLVGRLNPRKGPDVAIRALKRLVDDGLDANLTLVGSVYPGYEWFEDELRTLASDLDVADRIEFVGFQSDPTAFLERASIVLVPSRVEPFGTVAAEGMAAARPTVVTDIDGLAEIVDSDEVGLKFPVGDDRELAQRCADLLRNPDLAARIAVAGQHSVADRFSLEAYRRGVVTAVLETYERKRRS